MRAGATGLAQFDQHTQQSRVFLQHHHGGGWRIGGLFACRCFPRAPDVQSTLDSRVALKEPRNCFDVCRVALRSKNIFNNKARNFVFGSVACQMCTNMLSLFLVGGGNPRLCLCGHVVALALRLADSSVVSSAVILSRVPSSNLILT